ncbi:Glycosyl hydrolases family 18 [seawater metagenome]|uniref:Glycosyl hydrolases family 18 n=1 Tax=seawater metagenome TaxID=1561972 RepID=A0A5E8CLS5_9ZZZZ
MSSKKLIYYYQTFTSLKPLVKANLPNLYVYLASLHFGYNNDNTPYIHLNDSPPDDQPSLWQDVKNAHLNGIKILVLLGGAGGAFGDLFNNYNVFYDLLKNFLNKYNYIQGIDLDVEETVKMQDIQKLIKDIRSDFGEKFIITLAPVVYPMITDGPGLGGFSYKKLYQSNVGAYIDWFNVQCYGCYNFSTYNQIINNGYPEEQIVFGMLGDEYNSSNFSRALNEIKSVIKKYDDMGGCILWEYGDTQIDPITWGKKINNLFNSKRGCFY